MATLSDLAVLVPPYMSANISSMDDMDTNLNLISGDAREAIYSKVLHVFAAVVDDALREAYLRGKNAGAREALDNLQFDNLQFFDNESDSDEDLDSSLLMEIIDEVDYLIDEIDDDLTALEESVVAISNALLPWVMETNDRLLSLEENADADAAVIDALGLQIETLARRLDGYPAKAAASNDDDDIGEGVYLR